MSAFNLKKNEIQHDKYFLRLAWLTIYLFTSRVAFSTDLDAENRFRAEAPKGWSKLKLLDSTINVTGHLKLWATEDGKLVKTWGKNQLVRFIHNGDLRVMEIERIDSGGKEVYIAGKDYGFRLDKKNTASPFELKAIAKPEEVRKTIETRISASFAMSPNTTIWTLTLRELINLPGFKIQNVTSQVEDGKEVVKVEFSCPQGKKHPEFNDATMILYPGYDWALKSVEYFDQNKRKVTIHNEYYLNKESIPSLKSYRKANYYDKEKVEEFYEFDYEDVSYAAVPESRFTFSYYGLPEPQMAMAVQVESRMHRWMMAVAGLLFVSAITLRLIAMRIARKPAIFTK